MASIPSHVVAALSLGAWFYHPSVPKRVWMLGALGASLPDADVLAFALGIPYGAPLGHRGLSHSLLVAAAAAIATVAVGFPRGVAGLGPKRLALYFTLAIGSHGLLDALTDGGRGVALFAPITNDRYFFPVRPIEVSPIGLRPFLSGRGLAVLASEFRWIWLPSAVVVIVALAVRHSEKRRLENA